MYCKHCGEQLVDSKSTFCIKCGTKKGNGNTYCGNCGVTLINPNGDVCVNCGVKLKSTIDSMIGGDKNKIIAALLAFFLGTLGIHRFYLGYNAIGIILVVLTLLGFLTCGVTTIISTIWSIVDIVLILTGKLTDHEGNPLS